MANTSSNDLRVAVGTNLYIAPLILGASIVAVFMLFGRSSLVQYLYGPVPEFVALGVAIILAGAPIVACRAQTISQARQLSKLEDVAIDEVKRTNYYILAKSSLVSIAPASISEKSFRAPLILFATIITFCSLLAFMGLFWPDHLKQKTFLLGGMSIVDPKTSDDGIIAYQSGTLVAASVAFMGAYLALFRRLLDQLNNNDIYPISFHYYSAWLLSSMIIASVFRHVATLFGQNDTAFAGVILVSFAIGAAPAPFFAALLHAAFQKLRIAGDKDDPKGEFMPSNLNLLMIDGLTNEKIDRLAELGITDAEILACQNPFTMWTRLPYELTLIVDWISQAQLYVCLRDETFSKARDREIGDIHKFVSVLNDQDARSELCAALGLNANFVRPLLEGLNGNPCYVRLCAVRVAMLGAATPPDPSRTAAIVGSLDS